VRYPWKSLATLGLIFSRLIIDILICKVLNYARDQGKCLTFLTAENSGLFLAIILIRAGNGIFSIDMWSSHVKKICDGNMGGVGGRIQPHFRSNVCSLFHPILQRLISGVQPMTSWTQGNNFTATPGIY
jgi:hypothetical protein